MRFFERLARFYSLVVFAIRVKLLKRRLDAVEREAAKRAAEKRREEDRR